MATLEQALRIALDADLQEAAGRAYCQPAGVQRTALNRFAEAERYYAEGHGLLRGPRARRVQPCLLGWPGLAPAAAGALGRGGGRRAARC